MDNAYIQWIQELKQKIKSAQLKASIAVNEEMILLYWDIGKSIVEKQHAFAWGSKVVEQMAKDLKKELPDTQGFSRTNLFSMRKFYSFYANASIVQQAVVQLQVNDNQDNRQIILQAGGRNENDENKIIHQAGGQLYKDHIFCKIPWRHHVAILSNCSNIEDALFYLQQTLKNNWSRSILELQIESKPMDGRARRSITLNLPFPNHKAT